MTASTVQQRETTNEWIERLRRRDRERQTGLHDERGEVVHTVRFAPPRCVHPGCPSNAH